MTKDRFILLLKKAQSQGVMYDYAGDKIGGCYSIKVRDVADLAFGVDRDIIQARIINTTLPALLKWVKASQDYQCTATRVRGGRCENFVNPLTYHPKDFIYGVTDRCHLHKGH